MIIRKYGDFPAVQVPDVGEMVKARRSISGQYVRAVVVRKPRRLTTGIEIKVQWLADGPEIQTGDIGWLVQKPGRPPLVLRTSKAQPGDTPS